MPKRIWDTWREMFFTNEHGARVYTPLHAVRDIPPSLEQELEKMKSFKGDQGDPFYRGNIAESVIRGTDHCMRYYKRDVFGKKYLHAVVDATGVQILPPRNRVANPGRYSRYNNGWSRP